MSLLVSFDELPLDILDPIIENLTNRKDLRACTLVNREFNRVATPLLYHTLDSIAKVSKESSKKDAWSSTDDFRATTPCLDSRIKPSKDSVLSQKSVLHPCFTLLARPELAQHVRHITESGSIHNRGYIKLTEKALQALLLCTSLRSFTWTDDYDSGPILYRFIEGIKKLPRPLEVIKVRSHLDIGQHTYDSMISLSGLRSVSWFCMDGPPRVLQGWPELLGPTLTSLELGRCAGVPPSILISVLCQLPKLESLLLKGAPAFAVTNILGYLPNLKHLDSEYIPSGSSRSYSRSLGGAKDDPRPPLSTLIVRTSSNDFQAPRMLWSWIHEVAPGPEASLEILRLHAFIGVTNHLEVPRTFILHLARTHGSTLKQFAARSAQLTLTDIECLCNLFPQLEFIECSVWIERGDMESIKTAIAKGKNIRSLKLNVRSPFSARDATDLMLRTEDSKLRFISIDGFQYVGKWYVVDDGLSEAEIVARADYEIAYDARGERRTLQFIVSKTDSREENCTPPDISLLHAINTRFSRLTQSIIH